MGSLIAPRLAMPAAGLILLAGCASMPAPVQKLSRESIQQDTGYALRLDESRAVEFGGVVDFDQAGVNGSAMLYGPGAAAGIAGLIVHGSMLQSSRNKQKTEMQVEADKVLMPYEAVLKAFTQKELVDGVLTSDPASPRAGVARHAAGTTAGWIIDSAPVFSMTQDGSALVLDHLVTIQRSGAAKPSYQNSIRVLSQVRDEPDPAPYWNADGGAALKGESQRLYRDSLDLALRDAARAAPTAAAPHQTVRYREGRRERMERAQVLDMGCDRAVIRTLRGWLMSVPVTPGHPCVVPAEQPAEAAALQ